MGTWVPKGNDSFNCSYFVQLLANLTVEIITKLLPVMKMIIKMKLH